MDKIENVIPLPSLPLPLPMGALMLPRGVLSALEQSGVLGVLIAGDALSLAWGRKSSRVFVTDRSAAVASPIRVIEVHVDRIPVFRAYSEGAWKNGIDTSRFGGSGWLDWSEQRLVRDALRSSRRLHLEQYLTHCEECLQNLSTGVPLRHQEGQEGGVFVLSNGALVSAAGIFRKVHNKKHDSWEELQEWIKVVTDDRYY